MNAPNAAATWDPQVLRDLLIGALPTETSGHGAAPEPRFVYLPASHVKAVHPNAMVVAGMRGAGKSFWWAALQERLVRSMVAQFNPHAEVSEQTRVAVGFGERPGLKEYPDRDTLGDMLRKGTEPRLIWRTVVVHKLAPDGHPIHSQHHWEERLAWVEANPEPVGHLLDQQDRKWEQNQTWFLVLFDALDRSANNWKDMNRLVRGLLQVALEFRPYKRLRVKCFLRTDQIDESRVADFTDASKVLGAKIELSWPGPDLYGLLWQYIANVGDHRAKDFREAAQAKYLAKWSMLRAGELQVWRSDMPNDVQRELFHAVAGMWMGRDHRRGFPYTWIPGHLADADGRTSPRSFLAALRAAAEDTRQRYPDHSTVLHYESIKRGVQRASGIRVLELKEDYPWVDLLMKPLEGLVVPCAFEEVVERWEREQVLQNIRMRIEAQEERLPPAHLEEGPHGARKDLEELGIFVRMRDDRVNIPDVLRVGYGLGRRGGIKPIRKGEDS